MVQGGDRFPKDLLREGFKAIRGFGRCPMRKEGSLANFLPGPMWLGFCGSDGPAWNSPPISTAGGWEGCGNGGGRFSLGRKTWSLVRSTGCWGPYKEKETSAATALGNGPSKANGADFYGEVGPIRCFPRETIPIGD